MLVSQGSWRLASSPHHPLVVFLQHFAAKPDQREGDASDLCACDMHVPNDTLPQGLCCCGRGCPAVTNRPFPGKQMCSGWPLGWGLTVCGVFGVFAVWRACVARSCRAVRARLPAIPRAHSCRQARGGCYSLRPLHHHSRGPVLAWVAFRDSQVRKMGNDIVTMAVDELLDVKAVFSKLEPKTIARLMKTELPGLVS